MESTNIVWLPHGSQNDIKKVDQTTFGFPGGNCFSACIATVLGLPLDDVPYFIGDEDWSLNFSVWLRDLGLWPLILNCSPDWSPSGFTIMSGQSPRCPDDPDSLHIVVALDGEVWHDPHPSRAGLLTHVDHVILVPVRLA